MIAINRFFSATVSLLCFLAIIAASSCVSDDGPPMGRVKGQVNFDGKQIEEGVIHFSSKNGSTKTVSAFIRQGKFEELVPVGNHRVEISVVVAPPLASGQTPETLQARETIPSKYNSASELTAEAKSGTNDLKFDLVKK